MSSTPRVQHTTRHSLLRASPALFLLPFPLGLFSRPLLGAFFLGSDARDDIRERVVHNPDSLDFGRAITDDGRSIINSQNTYCGDAYEKRRVLDGPLVSVNLYWGQLGFALVHFRAETHPFARFLIHLEGSMMRSKIESRGESGKRLTVYCVSDYAAKDRMFPMEFVSTI